MIKQLINLANEFDKRGLRKEADYLDCLMKKAHEADNDEEGDPHGYHETDSHTLQGGTWHPETSDDGDTGFGNNIDDALSFIKQKAKENDGEFYLTSDPDWASDADMAWGIFDLAGDSSEEEENLANILVNRANKQFDTSLEVGYTPAAGYFSHGTLAVLKQA